MKKVETLSLEALQQKLAHNREAIKAHYKDDLGYFAADLLDGKI